MLSWVLLCFFFCLLLLFLLNSFWWKRVLHAFGVCFLAFLPLLVFASLLLCFSKRQQSQQQELEQGTTTRQRDATSRSSPIPLFIFKAIMPQVNNSNKNNKSNNSNSSNNGNSKIWPEEIQWTTWTTNENEAGQMTNRGARKIYDKIGTHWRACNEKQGKVRKIAGKPIEQQTKPMTKKWRTWKKTNG